MYTFICVFNSDVLLKSAKFTYLREKLPVLQKNGDRVLIFSQFTSLLDLLALLLNDMNILYVRLDGQTPVEERQLLIDEYNNNNEILVFLLSTKAGTCVYVYIYINICISIYVYVCILIYVFIMCMYVRI